MDLLADGAPGITRALQVISCKSRELLTLSGAYLAASLYPDIDHRVE